MAQHDFLDHPHTSTTCDFKDVILDSLDDDEEFDIPPTISDDEEDTLLEDDRTSQQLSLADHALENVLASSEVDESEDEDVGYVIIILFCGS